MLIAIMIAQLASRQHLLPTVIIEGDGAMCTTCPAADLENIKYIRQVMQDSLSRLIPTQCGVGLWQRVAYLNMSDPSQQCPSNWSKYNRNGIRACRRPLSTVGSCSSIFLPVNHQYSGVCGKVIGYPIVTTDAFTSSNGWANNATIDGPYLDGVSISHGNPRNHIWSFAAGARDPQNRHFTCPCVSGYTGPGPQPFVGDNYFCESGILDSIGFPPPNDKLWDGLMCSNEGTCCTNKSLPWFSRQLSTPTSDDIEVRICADEGTHNEGTPVELVEIYVQ